MDSLLISEDNNSFILHDDIERFKLPLLDSTDDLTFFSDTLSSINDANSNVKDLVLSESVNDFLNYIDPVPSKPPSYKKINPNRSIRYPIYESLKPCSTNENPPDYKPTISNFTIISMKSEYLSPYEKSFSKNWENFIMEINSTQLNFYEIDSSLTNKIKNYYSVASEICHLDNSKKFFQFNNKATYTFNKNDKEHICYNIERNKSNFLTTKNLVKSFTLQFAKFGIPIDYDKKTFVLRLRCESEQFLINFTHVDDMIDWTTYLSIGISVALDLELRDLPDYRIVPRRRSRRRRRRRTDKHRNKINFINKDKNKNKNNTSRTNSNTSSSSFTTNQSLTSSNSDSTKSDLLNSRRNSVVNTKNKIQPDPNYLKSKLKGFLKIGYNKKKLLTKSSPPLPTRSGSLKSYQTITNLNSLIEDDNESQGNDGVSLPGGMQFSGSKNSGLRSVSSPFCQATHLKLASATNNELESTCPKDTTKLSKITGNEYCKLVQKNSIILQHELSELREVIREQQEPDEEEDEEDDEEEEEEEEEDIFDNQNVHSLEHSLNEDVTSSTSVYSDEGIFHETDVEEHEYYFNYRRRSSSIMTSLSYGAVGNDDVKWRPSVKQVSRRREIRNCLGCIKPFLEDAEWVGFVCFKPTKNPNFETNNKPIWYSDKNNSKKHKQNANYQENSSMKNHYLDSYIVGPVNFLKVDNKAVRSIDKIRNRKNKAEDIDYQQFLS